MQNGATSKKGKDGSATPREPHNNKDEEVDDVESVLSASTARDEVTSQASSAEVVSSNINYRSMFTLGILVYINLLNYMDRYTISSVLINIKDWFRIGNSDAGLLQV